MWVHTHGFAFPSDVLFAIRSRWWRSPGIHSPDIYRGRRATRTYISYVCAQAGYAASFPSTNSRYGDVDIHVNWYVGPDGIAPYTGPAKRNETKRVRWTQDPTSIDTQLGRYTLFRTWTACEHEQRSAPTHSLSCRPRRDIG